MLQFIKRTLMAAALVLALGATAMGADKIKVLIVDGQNNHNWRAMTPFMKVQIEKTGLFSVDVSTTPPNNSKPDAWAKWRPQFKDYDVVLSNYNGQRWPKEVEHAFVSYITDGGKALIIHAANNAFSGWDEYDAMIGLGWRNNKYGKRLYIDESGKEVVQEPGDGPGAGHGAQHAYQITVRKPDHPIMKGLPTIWLHAQDELYHGQRGPAAHMFVLATAYSAKEKGGTGVNEPMVWVIPYGKGTVITNVMGHVSGNNIPALQCVGFITVMNRSLQWLATGKVTIPVPDNFPTADKVSMVDKE